MVPKIAADSHCRGNRRREQSFSRTYAASKDAAIRLIVDPIDGTRGIMYDKRSAWSVAGVAPNHGPDTRLRDIEIAVMTELPTSKMGSADVLWAIKGKGAHGRRVDLKTLARITNEISTVLAHHARPRIRQRGEFFPRNESARRPIYWKRSSVD